MSSWYEGKAHGKVVCRFCKRWAQGKDLCKKAECLNKANAENQARMLQVSRTARAKARRALGLGPEQAIPEEYTSGQELLPIHW